MEQRVWQDSRGMSLIEVMIAIVLLMIVSLALMQTSLVGYQTNVQNSMREEATRVADQEMGNLRNLAFDDLASSPTATVSRTFRGFTVTYSVTPTVTSIATLESKQITVEVSWPYRGRTYKHSITTIVGKT